MKQINDLKVETLLPFNREEVTIFVEKMLTSHDVKFDNSIAPRVIELLGSPIPLFLQLLTQELYRKWKRNRSETITSDTVNEVFNKTLLGEMARDKLQHYRSRIEMYYPDFEKEAACSLLTTISLSDNGISLNALFNIYKQIEEKKSAPRKATALNQSFQRLILYLQSDFYIEDTTDNKYDFSSKLLKTWWKKYYGYEYGDV